MVKRAVEAVPAASGDADTVAAASSGPRIPMHTEWLPLPGDWGEAGMKVLVWTDYPNRLWAKLQNPGNANGLEQTLRALVLEHNGWREADGTPLPDAQADGFWWSEGVSMELLDVVRGVLLDLPLAAARSRRTRPGSS
jgi:hypothetical protein